MRRAYSYVRFSSKAQADGDSLRRQLALTREYCKRRDLVLDEGLRLHDEGISAFRGKNAVIGALGAFRENVQTGRVPRGSVLIIESLDRLSRDAIDEALGLFLELLKAHIVIVTLQPEREYTEKSIKDITGLLEPLVVMQRAHEESAMKSHRARAAWDNKRERMSQIPATAVCPAWLRLKEDGRSFEKIKWACAAVRRIYQLARDGFGTGQITAILTKERVPPIGGRSGRWSQPYVRNILRTRAVIGEFQPHVVRDGQREPIGNPLREYYPPVISEKKWYATRRAVELRRTQRGRRGRLVTNLFTGIVFDARDGRSMVVRPKGEGSGGAYLVSSGRASGESSGPYISFQYPVFESYLLRWLNSDVAAELAADEGEPYREEIAALSGELIELDQKIERFKEKILVAPNFESLTDVLRRLEIRKRAKSRALEEARQEQANNHAETLGEARSIQVLLATCPREELLPLRTRLKARIRSLVKEAWVLIEGTRQGKWATVQLFLHNGKVSRFTFPQHTGAGALSGLGWDASRLPANDDLRQWRSQKGHQGFPRPSDGGSGCVIGGYAKWEVT
jgi:DNA invertase Pin-like site-specific DNA recombinase